MTKEARVYNGEKTVSSVSGAGTTDVHMNEFGSLLHTIYKI